MLMYPLKVCVLIMHSLVLCFTRMAQKRNGAFTIATICGKDMHALVWVNFMECQYGTKVGEGVPNLNADLGNYGCLK